MSRIHGGAQTAMPPRAQPGPTPDVGTFDDIVRLYRRRLVDTAYRITRNTEDAHDVAQYTFMQLYCRQPAFEDRRAVERWLYIVTRNQALCVFRTRERDAEVSSAAGDERQAPELEETVVRNELRAAVRATIARLPAAQRQVIELRHLQAMLASEIASEFGIPLKRVKRDVERARLRLRIELLRQGLDGDVG
jgi:RNA polymerase sigma-70 factor (ECF subfamily)